MNQSVVAMYRRVRGVTELIMTISLISIAVTASIFVYNLSTGTVGGTIKTASQQVEEGVIMEAYNFPVKGTLTISIRNIGDINVSLSEADFFLNGLPLTPDDGCKLTLRTGMSCTTALTVSAASLQQGASYPLKIVPSDGGFFSYPVVYGGSG